MMVLLQVQDQVNGEWCILYTGEDASYARTLGRAMLDAGFPEDRVQLGVGTLLRDTSDPSITWDAAAAQAAHDAAARHAS